MRVHKYSLLLIQILLAIFIVSLVGVFIWWLLGRESDVDSVALRVHMLRMQASTETYYARLQFYDGVCSDIGVNKDFKCNESTNAFAIETRLSSGRFLCLDSTGFLGEISRSKGEAVSCASTR